MRFTNSVKRLYTASAIGVATLVGMPSLQAAEEINVLLFSMSYTQGLAKLAGDFEEKTGIKANIEVVGQDVFENRITLTFTGKTDDLDVVHTPVIQLQRWVAADWLQPMTKAVAGMDTKDDILAGPLDAYKVNDEQWALPFFAEAGMMAYRKDLLADAGYDTPPATWDEVLEVAAAIKSDDVAGAAMRVAPGQGFNMFVFPMIMRAYGGKFFADYPTDLTPALNSPETLKGLEVYSSLMNDYGPPGIGNFNYNEVAAAMQTGQVAMIFDGTAVAAWTLDPEKSQYSDKIDLAPVPTGPAGRSPAIAVHGLGIPAGAPDTDLSFQFIEWATSEEVLTKIAISEAFADFTRGSVATNADVIAKYKSIHPKFLDLKVQMLGDAIGHYRPLLPQWPELGAAIGENINGAINGLMSNKEALEAAQEEMIEILAE